MRERRVGFEQVDPADGVVEAGQAQRREPPAHVRGDEPEELFHEFCSARELLPESGILGGDPDGACVEMTHPHEDAAEDHQGRRGEPELLGAEQRRDQHVPTGAQTAVALHGDAVAKAAQHEGLLGFGEPDLPRGAGVLQGGEQCGAGATVVAGDQDHVGMGLGDTGGDDPDADTADQFEVDAGPRVGAPQVVDEFGEVLDGVDVVVRRWGDQADARRGVPGAGDPRIHLVTGKLATFTGFRSLSHLDLQVGRVGEVVGGDAEAAAGDLFDGTAPQRVAEPVALLPALPRVRAAAEPVHRDGEGLVCLPGDRPVAHGPGGEAAHDLRLRLDLVERDRLRGDGAQQPAQRGARGGETVDLGAVACVDVRASRAGRVLQQEHRLGG